MSVFISHSEKDKVIVDPFVDLLQTGADLSQKNIFCTSLAGLGIPKGRNFIDFIREKVNSAELTIIIVSPSYYESAFCLCELGATWALRQDIFPLIVPPYQYGDLSAVLKGIQAGHMNNSETLNELYDRLLEKKLATKNTARWEQKKDSFIEKFTSLKENNKIFGSTVVPFTDFCLIKDKYGIAQETNQKNEETIEQLHNQIKELMQCKDKEETAAVMQKYSSENEIFDSLIEKVHDTLSPLSSHCIDALFCHITGGDYHLPPYFSNEHIHDEVNTDIQNRYLNNEENGITVNTDHPKIRRAIDALKQLQEFMDGLPKDSDFIDSFEDENEYPFDFSNREFWEGYLVR
jgi:hypothetical protein